MPNYEAWLYHSIIVLPRWLFSRLTDKLPRIDLPPESHHMTETILIAEKINEVREEMRKTGTWKNSLPEWVKEFGKRRTDAGDDFNEWLQFIYLPNMLLEVENKQQRPEKIFIVPQAVQFFGSDIQKGKLLQLLIELDSLS